MRRIVLAMVFASVLALVSAPPAAAFLGPHQGEVFYPCSFSLSSKDDPILYPGQPAAGSVSFFYGASTTDAYSTASSLLAGATTCRPAADHSAYWIPALMRNGNVQIPWKMHVYLRNSVAATPSPFPFGMKSVAGDPSAISAQPQWSKRYFWQCGDTKATTHYATPPNCVNDGDGLYDTLTLIIRFPQCWDGVSRDSAARLAYPVKGACPSASPVLVPQLQVHVQWYISDGASGLPLSLSSGSIYGIHAEFFDAWSSAGMNAVIKCIEGGTSCHW